MGEAQNFLTAPRRSGTLVSGSIKIMRVFAGVPEKSDFKRQWGRASCVRVNTDTPIPQQPSCRPGTLVSGNIKIEARL